MNINVLKEVIIDNPPKRKSMSKKELYEKIKLYIQKTCNNQRYLDELKEIRSIRKYNQFFIERFGLKAYHMYITRS